MTLETWSLIDECCLKVFARKITERTSELHKIRLLVRKDWNDTNFSLATKKKTMFVESTGIVVRIFHAYSEVFWRILKF